MRRRRGSGASIRTAAPPAVKTVEKALRVLLHLGTARRELSLGDLARGVGLHPSTTHRLLSVLSRHGFAQGGALRGHYVLGLRLAELGQMAVPGKNLSPTFSDPRTRVDGA